MAIWREDIVQVNEYSRPGYKLLGVKGIVMHWTATPGASDENEQKFFDGADGGGGRYASAHFFVDRDSATLILPLGEVGFHANEHPCRVDFLKGSITRPNGSTYVGGANVTALGVEMCVEKDGTIHPDTIERSAQVVAELCKIYKLDPITKIVRHYDVTGKNCPAPWVEDPSHLTGFRNRVKTILTPAPTPAPAPTGAYVVQKGDTLYSISKAKGVAVADIKSWNGLTSDVLSIGQVLKIVKPAPTPVAPVKPTPAPVTNKLVAPAPVIKGGDKSSQAKQLQLCLNSVGFNCGTPDGIFGAKSVDALTRFQSVYCNPADGVYGSKTRDALVKKLG